MPGYEYTFKGICERCHKFFNVSTTICNSINTDFASSYFDNLLNNKLNRVTCEHCKTEFTYERPFIAYSFNNKYAVMADFDCKGKVIQSGKSYLFDLFKISGMKFRIVNYMCEVSEKVRIFNANLDDYKIEHIKRTHFGDEYFNDKANKILLFKEIQNDNILFELYDDVDNVLEQHHIPFKEYENCNLCFDELTQTDGLINWYKTDNIKEIYDKH